MKGVNHQFRLAARPVDLPKRSDWMYVQEPRRQSEEGEFLVQILYRSLDRRWVVG